MGEIRVKGITEPATPEDGLRVLVEEVAEPAGQGVPIGWRLPEVAPSPGLVAWYGGDPARWQEFRMQYLHELEQNPALMRLAEAAQAGNLTLLTAARDPLLSGAEVLRGALRGR
jgi:uncharacterized protein YeaO (DUF488 family)